ncbi:hypothetical protein PVAP13_7KG188500 [Panicum virgatum]|uniref:Uncharacterized protein n=1 Tax=Panicum virgatum TaxID=38727 RepID=A0A8T0QIF5_PANVG|nr:hypothetical protein PVAP13_7KG188500 [Panicum virgatum]
MRTTTEAVRDERQSESYDLLRWTSPLVCRIKLQPLTIRRARRTSKGAADDVANPCLPFGHVRAAATARPGQANPWRRPPVQIPGPDWPPHESYRFVAIAPPLTERRAAEDFFFWGSDYVTQQSSKKFF